MIGFPSDVFESPFPWTLMTTCLEPACEKPEKKKKKKKLETRGEIRLKGKVLLLVF